MGSCSISYKELLRESERRLAGRYTINTEASIEELEDKINNYPHTALFYYYCGAATDKVMNDIATNGSCDELNASIGGLMSFEKFIGIRNYNNSDD